MDALHYLIIIHKIIIIQYLEITSQAIKYRYLIKSSLSTKFNTNFRRKNTSPVLPWAWVLLYFSLSSDNLGVLFQNKVKSDALRIALWIINFKEYLTKKTQSLVEVMSLLLPVCFSPAETCHFIVLLATNAVYPTSCWVTLKRMI